MIEALSAFVSNFIEISARNAIHRGNIKIKSIIGCSVMP